MREHGRSPVTRRARRRPWLAAAFVAIGLVASSCGGSDDDSSSSTATDAPTTTEDPVAAAQARVTAAQAQVTSASDAYHAAGQQFCDQAQDYVTALDRYGKLFTDSSATVGDVKTAGADLVAPRDSVSTAAAAVTSAQTDVADADQELAAAQDALATAQATASSVPAPPTSPPPTTTTVLAPSTISNVQRAESDLAKTSSGITDSTPLTEATAAYNAAALELEVAWLQLLAQAGCFSDEQQANAAKQIATYTTALQTDLQTAGYYQGQIDGIYGPQTVAAVEQLQKDSNLPVTGLVDQATAAALDKKVAAAGQQAAEHQMTQTAALQTVLALTGYWTGPIDGNWTPALTNALEQFQTALGVPPTGAVDAATIAAFQQALTEVKAAATATTTLPPTTEPRPTTPPPPATTAAPVTTHPPTTTTTVEPTTST
jgi:peptidoglycan hydrolase-like protein with peptidoglycan-binding domain